MFENKAYICIRQLGNNNLKREKMKKELLKGEDINFESEESSLTLTFGEVLGGGKEFKMWFNGKFIKICKTFKPMEKKLNEMIFKHGLIRIDE